LATLIYSQRAFADLDRLVAFVAQQGHPAAEQVVNLIAEAVELLEHHPLVGRPAEHDLRELVISRGKTGYVALYDYDADDDIVVILAIRHQREAGYR
jgi:addiction module RelE/StbE family toxin